MTRRGWALLTVVVVLIGFAAGTIALVASDGLSHGTQGEPALRLSSCECFETAPYPGTDWSALVFIGVPSDQRVSVRAIAVRMLGKPRFEAIYLVDDGAIKNVLVAGTVTGAEFPKQWRGLRYSVVPVGRAKLTPRHVYSLLVRFIAPPTSLMSGYDAMRIELTEGGRTVTRTFRVGAVQCALTLLHSNHCGPDAVIPWKAHRGTWRSLYVALSR